MVVQVFGQGSQAPRGVPELHTLTLLIQENVVRLDISRRTEGDKKISWNPCHSHPDISDSQGLSRHSTRGRGWKA